MLTYDSEKEAYVVPLDKKQLDGATAYGNDDMRFNDRDWNARIYDYYRVPPYWG
jgi:hypothetical protein